MKLQNKILLTVAAVIAAFTVGTASAQYRAVGNDGIAASPKVRQQIDDQNRATAKVAQTPSSHSCCQAVSLSQGCKTGCCTK
jgi:hypothetical protein